jgi:hypothetical protein
MRRSNQPKCHFGPLFPVGKKIKIMEQTIRDVLVLGHKMPRKEANAVKLQVSELIVKRNGHVLEFGSKREKEKMVLEWGPRGGVKKSVTVMKNYLYLKRVDGIHVMDMTLAEAHGYVEELSHALCDILTVTEEKTTSKQKATCGHSGNQIYVT